jgi:hypothetical protein
MLQPMKRFGFMAAITMGILKYVSTNHTADSLLALLALSGCIVFPLGGWHGDHHYDRGGRGNY